MKLKQTEKALSIAESFIERGKYKVGLHKEIMKKLLLQNKEGKFTQVFEKFKQDAVSKNDYYFFIELIYLNLRLNRRDRAIKVLKQMKGSFPHNYFIQDHYITQNNVLRFRKENVWG